MESSDFVKRNLFFEDVMGVSESDFFEYNPVNRAQFFVPGKDGKPNHLKNVKTGKTYQCGTFGIHELGDLIKKSNAKLEKEKGLNKKKGTFSVWEGADTFSGETMETYKVLDVGCMQSSPEFKDAIFDVASNFNCLETVKPDVDITSRNALLSHYIYDKTQGPFASISAAPGTIYRRYFVNFPKNPTNPKKWEQKPITKKFKDECVNLLSKLTDTENSPLSMSVGGYVGFVEFCTPQKGDFEKIRVGFHENVQVSHGAVNRSVHNRLKRKQIIHQMFSAAPDLGWSSGGLNMKHKQGSQWPNYISSWSQLLINGTREGIVRMAHLAGKKKVVLTLVGCGVFQNDVMWTAKAVERLRHVIVATGVDVILVWFDSRSCGHNTFRKALLESVKATGGEYRQYWEGKPLRLGT